MSSEKKSHVLRLVDHENEMYGVMISAELWDRVDKKIAPILESALEKMYPSAEHPEPLDAWETFKDYWDFRYPFNAEVKCECGAETADWEHDPEHPFRLKNVSLGGLVVFTCKKCHAQVQKKHFKDHMCYNYIPAKK